MFKAASCALAVVALRSCAYSFIGLIDEAPSYFLELSVDFAPFLLCCGLRYSAIANSITSLITSLGSLVQDEQATILEFSVQRLRTCSKVNYLSQIRRP